MEIKTWTTDESLPDQKTWKVSHRETTKYFEMESNSILAIIWMIYKIWKIERKKEIKSYINKLSLNKKGETPSNT